MMFFVDLGVVPFLMMSLLVTMAGLLMLVFHHWTELDRPFFDTLSFTVFIGSLLYGLGWTEYYLASRVLAACQSLF